MTCAAQGFLWILPPLIWACGGVGPPGSTRVDSAGVTIVTQPTDRAGVPSWHLSQQPLLVLGADPGLPGHDLFQVDHAVRLRDGRIVVADGASAELRYFDTAANLISRIGGRGDGPGEFQRIGWLRLRRGDSIVVYDNIQQRLSTLDATGHLVSSSAVRGYDSVPFPGLVDAWEDGTLLIRRGLLPPTFSGVQRPGFQLYLGHVGAFAVELIGEYAGADGYHLQVNQSVTVWPVPFGRQTTVVSTVDGWFVGDNEHFVINAFGRDGRRTRSFRRNEPPVPVRPSDVEAFVVDVLAGVSPDRVDRVAAVLEDVETYPTQPAFGAANHLWRLPSMLVDDEGNLWVLDYTWERHTPTSWTILSSVGNMIGVVTLPAQHSPLHVGRDVVVVRVQDDLDVETVQLYRLTRSELPG